MDSKLAHGIAAARPELSSLNGRAWDTRALREDAPLGRAEPSDGAAAGYTIASMAREFGVTIQEIKVYEDNGLLRPLPGASSCAYGPRERLHLKMILKGKALGFTLSEIRDILAAKDAEDDARAVTASDLVGTDLGAAAEQHEDFDAMTADWAMALRPEQIAAQIAHLERQRKALDDAIQVLREVHDRRVARDCGPGRGNAVSRPVSLRGDVARTG